MLRRHLVSGVVLVLLPVGVVLAAPARADCVDAGGTTVCAQGAVRGGGPSPPKAGPWVPYPCGYDWYCNDGGLSIILDGPR